MARIESINPWRARGDLRRAYRDLRHDIVGRLPVPSSLVVWNIVRVFSLRPALLRAFGRCFILTMWGGGLARSAKEAIGVTVARANSCHY
ncbi:MAG TPA: hypothetical protein VL371_05125 [Gemmataceae bacterium]|jgi:hypothetical protein|nr:hypothetical protein [Gemmataceae bacterium]